MPCNKCGRTLMLYDDLKLCSKCDCLAVLDTISAINISERVCDYLTKLFYERLKEWNSFHLITYCVVKREQVSREFYKKYSLFPTGELSMYTLLADRVLKNSYNSGGKRIDETNEHEVRRLVDTFDKLLNFENTVLHLKNCDMNVLITQSIDVDSITPQEAIRKCIFVSNEKHETLFRTYSINDIYSKTEGEKKIEEWSKLDDDYPSVRKIEILTPRNFIRKHFQILNNLYVLFMKDYAAFEVFGRLKRYKELTNEPRQFYHFFNEFVNFGDDVHTISPIEVFMARAKKYFSVSEDKIKEILIYSESNSNAFPLFIGFRENSKDMVVNSRAFCSFIYTLLHIFITRVDFDIVTQERSLDFEKQIVKERFEKNGYKYLSNETFKKELEIDGIAYKNNICYIIECKCWRLPHLIEEKNKRDEIIRDLKGIVLGEKYTTKDGKLTVNPRPSLVKKIEHVKLYCSKYLGSSNITDFKGLIVIPSYPPITNFQNIDIISLNDVNLL
jgi:hypothetical protein